MTILDGASLFFCLVSILLCIYAEDTDRFRQIFAREKGIRLQRHLGQLNYNFLCLKCCQTFNSYYESVFKCPIFWNMLTSLSCVNMSVQFTVPHRNISLWKQLTPLSFWKYTIVDISEWFIKTSFSAKCLALWHTVDCSTPNIILWHKFTSCEI